MYNGPMVNVPYSKPKYPVEKWDLLGKIANSRVRIINRNSSLQKQTLHLIPNTSHTCMHLSIHI